MSRRHRATSGAQAVKRPYSIERFAARYRPGVGGTGHALSVDLTKEMIRELLVDAVPTPKQQLVADIIMTEMLDPPDEIRFEMVAAVDCKFDATHMEIWRMMLQRYAKLQWGIDLTDGSEKR